jgi:hypothetical protein
MELKQDSPEYNDTLVLCTQRKYHQAVDKLKWLIVQCLFEMTKLGMNGVGALFFFDSHLVNSLFLLGYKL